MIIIVILILYTTLVTIRGIVPTMLRQGCNQAVNFTTYHLFKEKILKYQNKKELDHWQSLLLGGISGGFGPMANNPLGKMFMFEIIASLLN